MKKLAEWLPALLDQFLDNEDGFLRVDLVGMFDYRYSVVTGSILHKCMFDSGYICSPTSFELCR